MKTLVRTSLAVALAVAAVPAATAATPKKPTKAQKAEARAVVATTRSYLTAANAAVASLPVAVTGCEAELRSAESLPTEQQLVVVETFLQLAVVEVANAARGASAAYVSRLNRLRLRDATLRAGRVALVYQTQVLQTFARVPPSDTCAAIAQWGTTGWTAETRPSVPVSLDVYESARFVASVRAVEKMAKRLVQLGIAQRVVDELYGNDD